MAWIILACAGSALIGYQPVRDGLADLLRAVAFRVRHGPASITRRQALDIVMGDQFLRLEVVKKHEENEDVQGASGRALDVDTGQALIGD